LGAGLFSIGIPNNSVLAYESAIGAGKFALIAHGTPEDVARARVFLKNAEADAIDYNKPVDQLEPVVLTAMPDFRYVVQRS